LVERVGGGPGGISSLCELIDEFGEAVGADLLNIGRSLDQVGSVGFSWWDFKVWVSHRPPGSILHTKVHGEHFPLELRMLGLVVDYLQTANWQRSRNPARPKRHKWPWVVREDTETFGTAAPLEQIRDYLLLRNGRAPGR